MRNRGTINLAVVLVLAGLGALATWIAKPKVLDGDTRRANASVESTRQLEQATTAQATAVQAKTSEASASVQVMGRVISTLPESPEKNFLSQEQEVAQSKLGPADPAELLKAEQRRVAVLTGQIDESRRLYAQAFDHAKELEEKVAKTSQELATAQEQRDAIDRDLQTTAAERLGAQRERNLAAVIGVLLVALIAWVKLTHLSPKSWANAMTEIRNGENPITAFDTVATELQQGIVNRIVRLNTQPQELKTPPTTNHV